MYPSISLSAKDAETPRSQRLTNMAAAFRAMTSVVWPIDMQPCFQAMLQPANSPAGDFAPSPSITLSRRFHRDFVLGQHAVVVPGIGMAVYPVVQLGQRAARTTFWPPGLLT